MQPSKHAVESYEKQINPDTSDYECFLHYTDELLYCAGFEQGLKILEQETFKYISFLQSTIEKQNLRIEQLKTQVRNEMDIN